MDVEVRHTLAHAVVHGDERALRPEAALDRDREAPRVREERLDEVEGQVPEGLVMHLRHEEGVAWKERLAIEEGDRAVVLEDDVRGGRAAGDLAENAGHGRAAA